MAEKNTESAFKGEIIVTSRIVDYLSTGLYNSPAACLKELVNNSYDADATLVEIFIKPDANAILIADDGHGMTRQDFEKNFSRIAETFKRDENDITELNRPKIGKIGIGFIAANEICDVMEIESTVQGSNNAILVEIDFKQMRDQPLGIRRRKREKEEKEDSTDLAKGDYVGKEIPAERDDHYTRIFLKDVRGDARGILEGASAISGVGGHDYHLYGKSAAEIEQALKSLSIESWDDFDEYSKTMLAVGLNVPVEYHDNWAPRPLRSDLARFETQVAALGFEVTYDGSVLRKPIVLDPGDRRAFIEPFDLEGKHLSAYGYFYAQHGTIKPRDLTGLLVRIRHAAVGGYDDSFLEFPTSRGPLFQRWISAEIWADDGLEDALNIDRRTLRVSHPAYIELQKTVHEFLANLIPKIRRELYGAGSEARQKKKSKEQYEGLQRATSELRSTSPEVVEEVLSAWRRPQKKAGKKDPMLARFTVSELYELVVEVANEVLTSRDAKKFISLLTRKLTQED